ncbi:Kinesin-like protein kif21b [Cichlidogyrus casuarinus]|uniref:Kinesin-like protein n=1 Tax=Cichlidogyrus casuarinus TaxID=1844966 RepID=A0ABD2Q351_9PLAT
MSTNTSVKVVVRIRPQNDTELSNNDKICISKLPGYPQLSVGKESFTFDNVFEPDSRQENIFECIAKPLIDGVLKGYNATIIAYGQTGSGKTFTMGTSTEYFRSDEDLGIIPRAITYLFEQISQVNDAQFQVSAQFIEIYNENLIDLLNPAMDEASKKLLRIHENTDGQIYLTGVTSKLVTSLADTLRCLSDGSKFRQTGCTLMNAQSSRSHAIFTLVVRQQRSSFAPPPDGDPEPPVEKAVDRHIAVQYRLQVCAALMSGFQQAAGSNKENELPEVLQQVSDLETLTAKFHFVDLAGSERMHKTGATGLRAKEGISINCGLLALGNVISALADVEKRGMHVPYRDSKLTRLLQDSLGGNSQTAMIACVSPSDLNFLETCSTIRYANRAKNIKNKVSVNQDKTSKQLAFYREQVEALKAQLDDIRSGKLHVQSDGSLALNDVCIEVTYLWFF